MIKFAVLLIVLTGLFQAPETVEVVYHAASTSRYLEVEYLDEDAELQRLFIIENDGGTWSKTINMVPGRWAFAALGVKTVHGGVSCSLTVNGELVQKDRDTGRLPLSNCSGPVKGD